MASDSRAEARKRLDEVVNSTKPHSRERALARACREALTLFSDHPDFDYWVKELIKQVHPQLGIPFVVEKKEIEKKDKRKLAPLDHVGPTPPLAPMFQPYDDGFLTPEDFPGDDSESHYAAPALWTEIRKRREECGE